jgi:hypothetical protein
MDPIEILSQFIGIEFDGNVIWNYICADPQLLKIYDRKVLDTLHTHKTLIQAQNYQKQGIIAEEYTRQKLNWLYSGKAFRDLVSPDGNEYLETKAYALNKPKSQALLYVKLKEAKIEYNPQYYTIYDSQWGYKYTLICCGDYGHVVKKSKEYIWSKYGL